MRAGHLRYAAVLAICGLFHHLAGEPLCVITPTTGFAFAAEPGPDGLIASPEPDWPQWRGKRRDAISDETGLLPTWPEGGPRLLWKLGNLGRGWSSPIVVGRRCYITGDVEGDLVVYAFDLDGKLVWKTTNGKSWQDSYPGARAACAFSAGRLYHMNGHGRVACLDADSGKEIWAVDILRRFEARNITWAMSECLLVDGPRVIVTPGGKAALMAALDKDTGRTLWTTEPLEGDRASYSSPILFRLGKRRVLANCSADHGFGVDADTGKLLWAVPLRNQYGVNASTPVYGEGRVFYVTAYFPGGCFRLRSDNGDLRAEPAWPTALDTVTGGAVLTRGVLFAAGYRKPKHWFAVDWNTGQTLSELKELTTGAAVAAEGRLYCLAEDGRAALLDATGGRLRMAGEFRLVRERVNDAWAHPVLIHGRLYLRYHDTLWCYDVRQ
jgi:outer membrane protein assembly factor BamB